MNTVRRGCLKNFVAIARAIPGAREQPSLSKNRRAVLRIMTRVGFTRAFARILALALLSAPGLAAPERTAGRPRLDLTGAWSFYPDVGEASLEGVTNPPGRIVVPGAWQAQGYGKSGIRHRPHDGRLHLGLHQRIAGGGLLDAEAMPAALRPRSGRNHHRSL